MCLPSQLANIDGLKLPQMNSLVLILAAAAFTSSQSTSTGMYARSATPIWDLMETSSEQTSQIQIPSPDGTAHLVAERYEQGEDSGVQLALQRQTKTVWSEKFTPAVGIEMGWSPDSRAFFVTSSLGGRNGGYVLAVYLVNDETVTKTDVTRTIYAAFGHPVKCGWQENPNVAAVRWGADSRTLIVAAEVVNHSNCDSYGTFRTYQLSLPKARIIRTYGQIEAKRLFSDDLGWELKDAPDECIKEPASCWVETNHKTANKRVLPSDKARR